jgi:hypothetical protein
MPQDPNLYGQRPAKKQKKEISLSSSLDFTSQLKSLMTAPATSSSSSAIYSAPAASASAGRARPTKHKDDIFTAKVKRKHARPDEDLEASRRINLKDPQGTEDEKNELARTRRKMEEKARLYAAMKRGDYIAKEGEGEPLVDFDRKWADSNADDGEGHHSSSGSDHDDDDENENEVVEYTDEYGRTRQGTRVDVERQRRREQRRLLGAEELDRMSARPKAPERVIYGDEIQTAAFNPEDSTWSAMEQLAAKRDRTPTPPPDTHYDGNWEIRDKGVGFYHFSKDNETRKKEMEDLGKERENTERVRKGKDDEKERRRKEVEERRRKIEEKRAEKSKKMADSFLDGLAGEFAGTGNGTDGKTGASAAVLTTTTTTTTTPAKDGDQPPEKGA